MAFIDDIQIWAETIDTDAVSNTPQRLEISDNLWNKGYLRDVPVTTQSLNQFMYLVSGALLEIDSETQTFNKIFDKMYHVGYVHTVIGNANNPASYMGRGTWVAEGQGRVLVGAGQGTDTNGTSKTFSGGSVGGEYSHGIITSELPSQHNVGVTATTDDYTHTHDISVPTVGGAQTDIDITDVSSEDSISVETTSSDTHSHVVNTSVTEDEVGGGVDMDMLQPYLTVYMWRRTA